MSNPEEKTSEASENGEIDAKDIPANVHLMKTNNQLRELHTLIRDRTTLRSDFKFYADRLIRLTVEAALDQLPYVSHNVTHADGPLFRRFTTRKRNVVRFVDAKRRSDGERHSRMLQVSVRTSDENEGATRQFRN